MTACQPDNPRIVLAEGAAHATCACDTRDCAQSAADPVLKGRGLLLEDYENLPEDQIARYEQAYQRVLTCWQRFED